MADHLQKKAIRVSGHLEEKRGIYQMVLSWTDREGKRQRQSKSTGLQVRGNKKRAEDMLLDTRRAKEQELASMPDLGDPLFADFMEFIWLDAVRQEVKLTTFGGYQMNVQKAIAPWFREHGILLRKLTAEDINDFYASCLKRIKATSVLKFHANISKALKFAEKKGFVQRSVMEQVDRPKPQRFVGKFLTQSEVVALFEAVKGHKLELGVMLGAFYGLRRAEIVGLRWDAIDFEANTLTIKHTVTTATVDGKHLVVADDTTKTKSSFRTLPLVPSFKEKLLEIRAEQEHYREICGKSFNQEESQYIYTDPLGNRIKPQYLTDAFPKFMEKNGFRRMRFHDLRHSCASLLLANSVPLKQIQEWLGHSDFAITANTYAHLEFNSKMASANAMTWLGQTSMAKSLAHSSESEPKTICADFQYRLSEATRILLSAGMPMELVTEWLRQEDLSESDDLQRHFEEFMIKKNVDDVHRSGPSIGCKPDAL